MSYDYEIFLSYRRSPTVGRWVNTHLVPLLRERLSEVSPRDVRISCDSQIEGGSRWPDDLRRRLRRSGLLVCVWSADYFRSAWCMTEWKSFKQREALLNMNSPDDPRGLVYPIRYADGDHFPHEAKTTQWRRDFSNLNYPNESFRDTPKYIEFDALVQQMAADIVQQLDALPPWQDNFPVLESDPLPSFVMARPSL